jgi:hypothetical protein
MDSLTCQSNRRQARYYMTQNHEANCPKWQKPLSLCSKKVNQGDGINYPSTKPPSTYSYTKDSRLETVWAQNPDIGTSASFLIRPETSCDFPAEEGEVSERTIHLIEQVHNMRWDSMR